MQPPDSSGNSTAASISSIDSRPDTASATTAADRHDDAGPL